MVTRGRTITESDIVQFGTLTGDFNPMHFDAEFMKQHAFGRRVAHGMLTLSYAVGQIYQLGHIERTTLAFRGLEVKFSAPVFIGDTIHVESVATEKKEVRRMGGGWVTSEFRIINQDGVVVQSGTMTILIASQPSSGGGDKREVNAD
ncbi:MAG: MaoC family dehydratase N-terminal domain-containing protein [Chloroflexi bacterium]|nr:MaoC family dehydratase N-terminal domain-containing protein [Chloroflexota bacterium]